MVKNISPQQLAQIFPAMSSARVNHITPLINQVIQHYQIPYGALPEFLANIGHESGLFSIKAENMNYSADRMAVIWPGRYAVDPKAKDKVPNALAKSLHYKPRELANLTYNGRMGNRPNSDDGYNFRGGGFAQITGRDAYTKFALYANKKFQSNMSIEQVATLVQTDDGWAMDSAAWFFCEFKNLEQLAVDNKFGELVKRWNGGFIGIEERRKFYSRAEAVLK